MKSECFKKKDKWLSEPTSESNIYILNTDLVVFIENTDEAKTDFYEEQIYVHCPLEKRQYRLLISLYLLKTYSPGATTYSLEKRLYKVRN